jgi:ketosteroid isomerase-like protein
MSRLFLSLLAAACLFAGEPKPDVKSAVQAAENAWIEAMKSADKAGLEAVLADDIMYSHSNNKLETKADVIEAVTKGANKYLSIDLSDSKYRQYGNNVVVTNHKAVIKGSQAGVANLYVTHVWARTGGKWQMVNRQATRFPQ